MRANPGSHFYGFATMPGEYFTAFQITHGGFFYPTIDNVTLGAPQVPEPTTLLLPGAGLLGLGATRRRS